MGAEGATALASALERNSTLQSLFVYGECGGDAGVCDVCGCGVVNDDDAMRLGSMGSCGCVS
jgi:hypothetical protein